MLFYVATRSIALYSLAYGIFVYFITENMRHYPIINVHQSQPYLQPYPQPYEQELINNSESQTPEI